MWSAQSLGVKGFQIPTTSRQLWIHFALAIHLFLYRQPTCLRTRVSPEKSKGQAVLVGTSAAGLNDLKTTPVYPAMPGVEIHAQVLESALTRLWWRNLLRPAWIFLARF